jgi:hypothetical protein
MYCSMPAIIACPKVSVIVVEDGTEIAPGVGVTASRVTVEGLVESLQPSTSPAIAGRRPKARDRDIAHSCHGS